MRQKIVFCLFVMFLLVQAPVLAHAENYASEDDARAMLRRAVELIKRDGDSASFAAFNAGGAWKDRELYVTVTGIDGYCYANSNVPSMVGLNLFNLKDIDGKYFVRDFVMIDREGIVFYKWLHPITKRIAQKKAFVMRIGDKVVIVGAYINL